MWMTVGICHDPSAKDAEAAVRFVLSCGEGSRTSKAHLRAGTVQTNSAHGGLSAKGQTLSIFEPCLESECVAHRCWQVQQRYRSIEAIFRESFEHLENEDASHATKGRKGQPLAQIQMTGTGAQQR